jgi:SAM-dependent methyltransferase
LDSSPFALRQTGADSGLLDLGCGPGLYSSRLARLGHVCTGIDFAPASIQYAREQAGQGHLPCTYIEEDIRSAEYGSGFDLIMLIFGEFNVFRLDDAQRILMKSAAALAGGGLMLLEPHTFEAVHRLGHQPPSWYASRDGLFSERPHICLKESFWDAELRVATERFSSSTRTQAR